MIDISLFLSSLPHLLRSTLVTLQIAGISCIIGLTFGIILGFAHSINNKLLRLAINIYTTVIRGTPMLIQILFVIYVLPQLGLKISAFWGAIGAIGLNSSAYVSHIIRSGIAAVGKGQVEAAKTLGFSRFQIMYYIILPQAVRVVIPALGNELITLIKDSSLASIVGVVELTKEGTIIISRTYDALTIYCAVAILYLILTSTLSCAVFYLEQRMNRYAHH